MAEEQPSGKWGDMKTCIAACSLALVLLGCNRQEPTADPQQQSERRQEALGIPVKGHVDEAPRKTAWDGPFGFQMGLTTEQIRTSFKVAMERGDTLLLTEAPKPYPLFEGYGLMFGSSGLCRVTAMKPDLPTDSGGTVLRERVDKLAEELEGRYGRGAKRDFLMKGSIWKEPQEWVEALQRQERTYTYTWLKETGARLPESIQAISLETKAISRDRGQIILMYEFANFTQCLSELKGKQQAGL